MIVVHFYSFSAGHTIPFSKQAMPGIACRKFRVAFRRSLSQVQGLFPAFSGKQTGISTTLNFTMVMERKIPGLILWQILLSGNTFEENQV